MKPAVQASVGISVLLTALGIAVWYQQQQNEKGKKGRKKLVTNSAVASQSQKTVEEAIAYIGLYNEGATCYLNSLIQTLYHIPVFKSVLLLHNFLLQTSSHLFLKGCLFHSEFFQIFHYWWITESVLCTRNSIYFSDFSQTFD